MTHACSFPMHFFLYCKVIKIEAEITMFSTMTLLWGKDSKLFIPCATTLLKGKLQGIELTKP